jgi:Spy/CpxP family protein refolding chaperone
MNAKHQTKEKKMKVKHLVIAALATLMIFGGVFMASAQNYRGMGQGYCDGPGGGKGFHGGKGRHGGGKGYRGGMGMGLRFLAGLNLTAEQEGKVRDILNTHREELDTNRQAVYTAQTALATVIHGENPGETDLRNAFQAVSGARENAMILRVKIMNEIKQILTDEQKSALAEQQALRMERMKNRFERKTECLQSWPDGLDS